MIEIFESMCPDSRHRFPAFLPTVLEDVQIPPTPLLDLVKGRHPQAAQAIGIGMAIFVTDVRTHSQNPSNKFSTFGGLANPAAK
jgi:hypothetical protein